MVQEIHAALIFRAPVNRSLFATPALVVFVSLAFISAVILIDQHNIAMETVLNFTLTSFFFHIKKNPKRTNQAINVFKNIHTCLSLFNKIFFCAMYAMELTSPCLDCGAGTACRPHPS